MKNTYTKDQLQKKAQEGVFKTYPKATKAYATTDGLEFLSQNRAYLHAGAKGKVFEVVNDNPTPDVQQKPKATAKGNLANSQPEADKANGVKANTEDTGNTEDTRTPEEIKAEQVAKMQAAKEDAKNLKDKVSAATSTEEVDAIVKDVAYKSVLKAADAKKEELTKSDN